MAKKTDQKILDLINEVKRREAEISKAERPNWLTNCSFSHTDNDTRLPVNLHVEANIRNLVLIAGHLIAIERMYNEGCEKLGITAQTCTWGGFPISDWLEDIKTRINKIQIKTKRDQLNELKKRLDAIVSPELRAELELQAIEEALQ